MAKRRIKMLYGERLVPFSKRVPESKYGEIEARWDAMMKGYENLQTVEIEVSASEKSNPADSNKVLGVQLPPHAKFISNTDNKELIDGILKVSGLGAVADREFETEPIDKYFKETKQGVVITKDFDLPNAGIQKTFTDIYECQEVDRGIPAEEDRIYHGVRTKIAFLDRDDSSVKYVCWEGKHYRFTQDAEFKKFLSNNNIR